MQMLVNAEITYRDNKRYRSILKHARLKFLAMPEDIDYRHERGLDRSVVAELLTCDWVERRRNLIMTGATGCGKTWLSCALAMQAARKGLMVAYRQIGRFLDDLAIAREDGTLNRLRKQLAKVQVLILDDFGLTAMSSRGKADLFELLDDRYSNLSTIVLGQMPWKDWHNHINDPALADAILDRLVPGAMKLSLKGDSMRQTKADSGK
jgi:DNA replication protein DnaC